jgi:hypothetical protein
LAVFRCKEIQDREKRGRVDQEAAKRLVSSGLWQPGQEKLRQANHSRHHSHIPKSRDKCVKIFGLILSDQYLYKKNLNLLTL